VSLFACSECGFIDNTASSGYYTRKLEGLPLLCSQCDPEIGEWHGRFPRMTVEEYEARFGEGTVRRR
jgi:hypothetical protein